MKNLQFWDSRRYRSYEQAKKANDFVTHPVPDDFDTTVLNGVIDTIRRFTPLVVVTFEVEVKK